MIHKFIPLFLILCLNGCRQEEIYTGYIEGDFVQVATSLSGNLIELTVNRGDFIQKHQLLYRLEQDNETYGVQEAKEALSAAEFEYTDLTKGKRKEEIESLEMAKQQAKTVLELAEIEYERQKKLMQVGGTSQEELDKAKATYESNASQLISLAAQLRLAHLGAREDQISAAAAKVRTAEANLRQAEWRLKEKTICAPVSARVQDTLYRKGEWVGAGAPVVVLLPPENVKARFFINEQMLGKIKIGQKINVKCDGCPEPVFANINFISEEAEYTPPVIFSRESRSKLVFMVEANIPPDKTDRLRPGQPIDISLVSP